MRIGFTGTREGMTEDQFSKVKGFIGVYTPYISEFHHGDCIGADEEVAKWVRNGSRLVVLIVAHPPILTQYRAFFPSDHSWPEKAYLDRDRDIVDACDLLVAAPKFADRPDQARSGTWYTVRYAWRRSVPVLVVTP